MKNWYGNIEKDEEFKLFPPLDAEKCTAEANALFKPYLFFHRGRDTIELWSSCCNKHEVMERIPRVIDSVTSRIVYGEHNYEAICPFCGRAVTLKNTAHLGKRKNLLEYQPVLWLRERDGKLYARAMWARKDYQGALDAPPLFCDTYAYAFEEGRVQSYYIYGKLRKNEISGSYDPRQTEIREPFMEGSNLMAYYVGYHVFGLSEIYKSPFYRYCQYDSYEREWSDGTRDRLIKYLALYSLHPQIEMFMKMGMRDLIDDMLNKRKKNAAIINWQGQTMTEIFGLSKQEMREWRSSKAPIAAIGAYKRLKRAGIGQQFSEIEYIYLKYPNPEKFFSVCVKRRIKPSRLNTYLHKVREAGEWLSGIWQIWSDYITMAEELGWTIEESSVLMPKDLHRKHDEATKELQLKHEREAAEQDKLLRLELIERMQKWRKKYNIERDGYFIRVAENAKEIRQEGKTLCHCVGGYAERHMNGKLTILFLRRTETPEVPLYTIEMHGNQLIQIHGYKNEVGTGAENPRIKMDWLLTPWLEWLKKGSPRDKKTGVAKLPKDKEVKTA